MARPSDPFPFLKRIYQNLDPNKPLRPGNEFYVPVYSGSDGYDPVEEIKTRIQFSDGESRHFFSGFRGSGKTTELFRLKQELEELGYIVFYANALRYLNPNLPIEISDLLIVLAGAFSDAIEDANPTIRLVHESYWERLRHYLTTTEIEWKEFSLATKDVGSLKASLLETPSFRQKVQELMSSRLSELEGQVKKFFEDGVKAIREERPGAQIVFLFDQLEQLRGTRRTDQEVLASVERLFAQYRDRLNLPFIHAVYTVPPWLKFILPGTAITILPSIRQWENNETRVACAAGNERLWRVLEARFGSREELLEFFGSEAGVGRILAMCGGHFRDLLRLAAHTVVLTKQPPASGSAIDAAIREARSSYLPIAAADAVWLQNIAESRSAGLQTADAADVNRFTHFLDTHLVLFLRNGEEWYDVHPLIREEVAEEALRAARAVVPPAHG